MCIYVMEKKIESELTSYFLFEQLENMNRNEVG